MGVGEPVEEVVVIEDQECSGGDTCMNVYVLSLVLGSPSPRHKS
jgi:hypothetical protein